MKKYVVGFIFSPDLTQVLLIEKINPQWQRGKLNGIGGKIEEGESPVDCMRRETTEETSLIIKDWQELGDLEGEDWVVYLFATIYQDKLEDAKTVEKEKVGWFKKDSLPKNVITNLTWLIPFAIEKLTTAPTFKLSAKY